VLTLANSIAARLAGPRNRALASASGAAVRCESSSPSTPCANQLHGDADDHEHHSGSILTTVIVSITRAPERTPRALEAARAPKITARVITRTGRRWC
jgi:hypothetical protein